MNIEKLRKRQAAILAALQAIKPLSVSEAELQATAKYKDRIHKQRRSTVASVLTMTLVAGVLCLIIATVKGMLTGFGEPDVKNVAVAGAFLLTAFFVLVMPVRNDLLPLVWSADPSAVSDYANKSDLRELEDEDHLKVLELSAKHPILHPIVEAWLQSGHPLRAGQLYDIQAYISTEQDISRLESAQSAFFNAGSPQIDQQQ